MSFGRILTAMVTPFDENGRIDFSKTTELVEYLIANGSDGLVVAGTTGESPTLSVDEKVELFHHVVKTVDSRVSVIAGTGSNNTQASVELTKRVEPLGVDGIMLVSPYYNKPSQQGLYEHFKKVADSTSLPIVLYDVPGRTVVRLNADTVVRLSQIDNIVAIKDASGDLDKMAEIIEQTDDDFVLYTGEDSLTLPTKAIGGKGVISVSAHIIGNEMQEMLNYFDQGNVRQAAKLHRHLLPVMKGVFLAPSPAPVKAALKWKGIDAGSVRLPIIPLTDEENKQLESLLKGIY
ncbi:4-hydroxy-tetrahydrodipicolinate synthase [Salinibacillus kushneri]|uniref:4-hydroxy-tetrahydrodipicolinate synthase n=1 Tax=Salinibacillus kushneri TaxID=237682 RepID=A0A1I0E4V9_9BACI|nr:4-hydroxy-tetrahydrodipicolinate synthase [Salinibacillus kushneri]SET39920.1 4-hydroxy-tetrahydrodipicolinate synthase [Salinibacillus kushneri]